MRNVIGVNGMCVYSKDQGSLDPKTKNGTKQSVMELKGIRINKLSIKLGSQVNS
jgi:hypothetical protein